MQKKKHMNKKKRHIKSVSKFHCNHMQDLLLKEIYEGYNDENNDNVYLEKKRRKKKKTQNKYVERLKSLYSEVKLEKCLKYGLQNIKKIKKKNYAAKIIFLKIIGNCYFYFENYKSSSLTYILLSKYMKRIVNKNKIEIFYNAGVIFTKYFLQTNNVSYYLSAKSCFNYSLLYNDKESTRFNELIYNNIRRIFKKYFITDMTKNIIQGYKKETNTNNSNNKEISDLYNSIHDKNNTHSYLPLYSGEKWNEYNFLDTDFPLCLYNSIVFTADVFNLPKNKKKTYHRKIMKEQTWYFNKTNKFIVKNSFEGMYEQNGMHGYYNDSKKNCIIRRNPQNNVKHSYNDNSLEPLSFLCNGKNKKLSMNVYNNKYIDSLKNSNLNDKIFNNASDTSSDIESGKDNFTNKYNSNIKYNNIREKYSGNVSSDYDVIYKGNNLFYNHNLGGINNLSVGKNMKKIYKGYKMSLIDEYSDVINNKNKDIGIIKVPKNKSFVDFFRSMYEASLKNKFDVVLKFYDEPEDELNWMSKNGSNSGIKRGRKRKDEKENYMKTLGDDIHDVPIEYNNGKNMSSWESEKKNYTDSCSEEIDSIVINRNDSLCNYNNFQKGFQRNMTNIYDNNILNRKNENVIKGNNGYNEFVHLMNLYKEIKNEINYIRCNYNTMDNNFNDKKEIEEIIVNNINKFNKKRIRDKVKKLSLYNNYTLSDAADKMIDNINSLFVIKNYSKFLKSIKKNNNISHIYYLYENMYGIDKFDHINSSNIFNISHFIIDIFLLKNIKEKDYLKKKIKKLKYSFKNIFQFNSLPVHLKNIINDLSTHNSKQIKKNETVDNIYIQSLLKKRKKETDIKNVSSDCNDGNSNNSKKGVSKVNENSYMGNIKKKKKNFKSGMMNDSNKTNENNLKYYLNNKSEIENELQLIIEKRKDGNSVNHSIEISEQVINIENEHNNINWDDKNILRNDLESLSSSSTGESHFNKIPKVSYNYNMEREKLYIDMRKENNDMFDDIIDFYEFFNSSNVSYFTKHRIEEITLILFYHYCNNNYGFMLKDFLLKIFIFFTYNNIINKKNIHEYPSFIKLYGLYLSSINCDPIKHFYHNIERDTEEINNFREIHKKYREQKSINFTYGNDWTSTDESELKSDDYISVIYCHLCMLQLLYKCYLKKLHKYTYFPNMNLENIINNTFEILNCLLIRHSYNKQIGEIKSHVLIIFLQFLYINSKYYFKNVTFFLNKYDINYLVKSEQNNFYSANTEEIDKFVIYKDIAETVPGNDGTDIGQEISEETVGSIRCEDELENEKDAEEKQEVEAENETEEEKEIEEEEEIESKQEIEEDEEETEKEESRGEDSQMENNICEENGIEDDEEGYNNSGSGDKNREESNDINEKNSSNSRSIDEGNNRSSDEYIDDQNGKRDNERSEKGTDYKIMNQIENRSEKISSTRSSSKSDEENSGRSSEFSSNEMSYYIKEANSYSNEASKSNEVSNSSSVLSVERNTINCDSSEHVYNKDFAKENIIMDNMNYEMTKFEKFQKFITRLDENINITFSSFLKCYNKCFLILNLGIHQHEILRKIIRRKIKKIKNYCNSLYSILKIKKLPINNNYNFVLDEINYNLLNKNIFSKPSFFKVLKEDKYVFELYKYDSSNLRNMYEENKNKYGNGNRKYIPDENNLFKILLLYKNTKRDKYMRKKVSIAKKRYIVLLNSYEYIKKLICNELKKNDILNLYKRAKSIDENFNSSIDYLHSLFDSRLCFLFLSYELQNVIIDFLKDSIDFIISGVEKDAEVDEFRKVRKICVSKGIHKDKYKRNRTDNIMRFFLVKKIMKIYNIIFSFFYLRLNSFLKHNANKLYKIIGKRVENVFSYDDKDTWNTLNMFNFINYRYGCSYNFLNEIFTSFHIFVNNLIKVDVYIQLDKKLIGKKKSVKKKYNLYNYHPGDNDAYKNMKTAPMDYNEIPKYPKMRKNSCRSNMCEKNKINGVYFNKNRIYKIINEVKKNVTIGGKFKIKNDILEKKIGTKINKYFGFFIKNKNLKKKVMNKFDNTYRAHELYVKPKNNKPNNNNYTSFDFVENAVSYMNNAYNNNKNVNIQKKKIMIKKSIKKDTNVERKIFSFLRVYPRFHLYINKYSNGKYEKINLKRRKIKNISRKVGRRGNNNMYMPQKLWSNKSLIKHMYKSKTIIDNYNKLNKLKKKFKKKLNNISLFKYIPIVDKHGSKIYSSLYRTYSHILFILISILYIENYNILHIRKNHDVFMNNDIYNTYYIFVHISSSIILLLSSPLRTYLHFNPSVGSKRINISTKRGITRSMNSQKIYRNEFQNSNISIAKDEQEKKIKGHMEECNIYVNTLLCFSYTNILLISKKGNNKGNKIKRNKYIYAFCNLIENILQNVMFFYELYNSAKNGNDILEVDDNFSKLNKMCKENNLIENYIPIKNALIFHSLFKYIIPDKYCNYFNIRESELYNMKKCSLNLFYFSLNILLTTFNTDISINIERCLYNINYFCYEKLYYEIILSNVKKVIKGLKLDNRKSSFNCIYSCVLYYLHKYGKNCTNSLKVETSHNNIEQRKKNDNSNCRPQKYSQLQDSVSSLYNKINEVNNILHVYKDNSINDDESDVGRDVKGQSYLCTYGKKENAIFDNANTNYGCKNGIHELNNREKMNRREVLSKIIYDMVEPYIDIKHIEVYNKIYRSHDSINSLINICFSFLFNNLLFLKPVYPFDIPSKDKNENEINEKKNNNKITNYNFDIFNIKMDKMKASELFLSLYIHKYMHSISLDIKKLVDYNMFMNLFFWMSNKMHTTINHRNYVYLNYSFYNVYYKFNEYNVLQFLVNFKRSKSEGKEFMMSFVKMFEKLISLGSDLSSDFADPLAYNVYLDYMNDLFLNDDYYYVCFCDYIKNTYIEENDLNRNEFEFFMTELNELNPFKIGEDVKNKIHEGFGMNYLILVVKKKLCEDICKYKNISNDTNNILEDLDHVDINLDYKNENIYNFENKNDLIWELKELHEEQKNKKKLMFKSFKNRYKIKIKLNNNPYYFKNIYKYYRNNLFILINKKNIDYFEIIKVINKKGYNHFSNMFFSYFIHILSEVKYDYSRQYNFNIQKIMDKLNIGLKASFYNNKNVMLYYYLFQQYFYLYIFSEYKYFSELVCSEYFLLNLSMKSVNNSLYNTDAYRIYCFLKFLYIKNILNHTDTLLNFLIYIYYKYFCYHYKEKDEKFPHFIDMFLSIHEESCNSTLLFANYKSKEINFEANLEKGSMVTKNGLNSYIGEIIKNPENESNQDISTESNPAYEFKHNGSMITDSISNMYKNEDINNEENEKENEEKYVKTDERRNEYSNAKNCNLVLLNSQDRFINILFYKILINFIKSKVNTLNSKYIFDNANFYISSYIKYLLFYTFEKKNKVFGNALKYKYSFYNFKALKKNLKLCLYIKNLYLKQDLFNSNILSFLNLESNRTKKIKSAKRISKNMKQVRGESIDDLVQNINIYKNNSTICKAEEFNFNDENVIEKISEKSEEKYNENKNVCNDNSEENKQLLNILGCMQNEKKYRKRLNIEDENDNDDVHMTNKKLCIKEENIEFDGEIKNIGDGKDEHKLNPTIEERKESEIMKAKEIISGQSTYIADIKKIKIEIEENSKSVDYINADSEKGKGNGHNGDLSDSTPKERDKENLNKKKNEFNIGKIKIKTENVNEINKSLSKFNKGDVLINLFLEKKENVQKNISIKYYVKIFNFYLKNRVHEYYINSLDFSKFQDKSIYLVFIFLGKLFNFFANSLLSYIDDDNFKAYKKNKIIVRNRNKTDPDSLEKYYSYEYLLLHFILISICNYADTLSFLCMSFMDISHLRKDEEEREFEEAQGVEENRSIEENEEAQTDGEQDKECDSCDKENSKGIKKIELMKNLKNLTIRNYTDLCESNNFKKNIFTLKPSFLDTNIYYMFRKKSIDIINSDKESAKIIIPIYKLLVARLKICLYNPTYFFIASLFSYKYDTKLSNVLLNYIKSSDFNIKDIKYYICEENKMESQSEFQWDKHKEINNNENSKCLNALKENDSRKDNNNLANITKDNPHSNREQFGSIVRGLFMNMKKRTFKVASLCRGNDKEVDTSNSEALNSYNNKSINMNAPDYVNYYNNYHEDTDFNYKNIQCYGNPSNNTESDDAVDNKMELSSQTHGENFALNILNMNKENSASPDINKSNINIRNETIDLTKDIEIDGNKLREEGTYDITKVKVVINNIVIKYKDVINDIIEGLDFISENKNCENYNFHAAYHACTYYFLRKNYDKCIHYMKVFVIKGAFKVCKIDSIYPDYYNLYCKRIQRREFCIIKYCTLILEVSKSVLTNLLLKINDNICLEYKKLQGNICSDNLNVEIKKILLEEKLLNINKDEQNKENTKESNFGNNIPDQVMDDKIDTNIIQDDSNTGKVKENNDEINSQNKDTNIEECDTKENSMNLNDKNSSDGVYCKKKTEDYENDQKENKLLSKENKWVYLGFENLNHLNEIYDVLKILFEIYIHIGKKIKRFNDFKILEDATAIYGYNISIVNVLFTLIIEHLCFIFEVLCYFTPHVLVYPIILLFGSELTNDDNLEESIVIDNNSHSKIENKNNNSNNYFYLNKAAHNEEIMYNNSACATMDLRIFKLFREFIANKSAIFPSDLSTKMHSVFLLLCKKLLYYQNSEQDMIKNIHNYHIKGNKKKKKSVMKFVTDAMNNPYKTKLSDFLNLMKNRKFLNCKSYIKCENIKFLSGKLVYNSKDTDINKNSSEIIQLDVTSENNNNPSIENTLPTLGNTTNNLNNKVNSDLLQSNDSLTIEKDNEISMYYIKLHNDMNICLYDDFDIFNEIRTKNEALNYVNSMLTDKNLGSKKMDNSNLKKKKTMESSITYVKNSIRERDLRRLNREKSKTS
ncbi:conserved Plasmodium protein, unknown function [Plasmodium berghei]|uniref:Uncharacterized protein n=1 Tax=Plasmodium berghei TaxID=5821 RepID=A0A122IVF2_PLABE|nr:conserved Plasmodium protein, unknown function [Plasmodium berghei]SCO62437.1 conserved Plasmodium protein, unknown function [Plasmodium berghei]